MFLYLIKFKIFEIGITFTNARCASFNIVIVLNTVILPAVDKFRILQSLKSFAIFKTGSIKFS